MGPVVLAVVVICAYGPQVARLVGEGADTRVPIHFASGDRPLRDTVEDPDNGFQPIIYQLLRS